MRPPTGRRAARAARAQANRVLVVAGLVVLLPLVALVGSVRPSAGRRVARWGVSVAAALCGVRFERRGERTATCATPVLVPNHSSPMDVPALLWAEPQVRFLAAADLFRVPLLARAMRAVGTVAIDRRDRDRARAQLDELVERRRAGTDTGALVVFPEGGIAPGDRRLPFKSGAFVLAIRSATPVVPVVIRGADVVLPPRGRLLVRPGVVTVEFLAPVDTSGLTLADRGVLRDHVRDVIVAART